jgi:hypothetical protein
MNFVPMLKVGMRRRHKCPCAKHALFIDSAWWRIAVLSGWRKPCVTSSAPLPVCHDTKRVGTISGWWTELKNQKYLTNPGHYFLWVGGSIEYNGGGHFANSFGATKKHLPI